MSVDPSLDYFSSTVCFAVPKGTRALQHKSEVERWILGNLEEKRTLGNSLSPIFRVYSEVNTIILPIFSHMSSNSSNIFQWILVIGTFFWFWHFSISTATRSSGLFAGQSCQFRDNVRVNLGKIISDSHWSLADSLCVTVTSKSLAFAVNLLWDFFGKKSQGSGLPTEKGPAFAGPFEC